MDTIAESAARLCDAKDAVIFRVEGDVQQRVAVYGAMPTTAIGMRGITRGTPVGRAIIDRETIHIHDIAEEIETEFPRILALSKKLPALEPRSPHRLCATVCLSA